MSGIDAALVAMPVPLWTAVSAAGLAALAASLLAARLNGSVVTRIFTGVLTGAAVLAAVVGVYDRWRGAERHLLAQRSLELARTALVPGSALACLDPQVGPTVEDGCEPVLFGRPETIAAVVTYVGAQLTLMSDADKQALSDAEVAGLLAPLRDSLAADRFGVVAHLAANRGLCTAEACERFPLVEDTSQIRANIRGHKFEFLLARHASAWPVAGRPAALIADKTPTASTSPGPTVAADPPAAVSAVAPPASGPASASPPSGQTAARYDFPTASSIPPVSIMDPEPGPAARGGRPQAPPSANATPKPAVQAAAPAPAAKPPAARSAPRTRPATPRSVPAAPPPASAPAEPSAPPSEAPAAE